MLDHALICADMKFRKCVFAGAVGGLTDAFEIGDLCTPAELFEVPSVALLAVSDNSATGVPLLGRGEELAQKYRYTRGFVIPDMIFRIAAM